MIELEFGLLEEGTGVYLCFGRSRSSLNSDEPLTVIKNASRRQNGIPMLRSIRRLVSAPLPPFFTFGWPTSAPVLESILALRWHVIRNPYLPVEMEQHCLS